MEETTFLNALSDLPLGEVRFFSQAGSTNDVALTWAGAGAPDLSLVYAEEQTSGRGRGKRSWFTPPSAALAFSLILRPHGKEQATIPLFSALGALAACQVLESYGLPAQIKWPNDVLVNRRKLCGILAESVWVGDQVQSIVLGIGLNIAPESVPPAKDLLFPATCLVDELLAQQPQALSRSVDRLELLHQVLQALLVWRDRLGTGFFFSAWESRLAFRGEPVEVWGQQARVIQGTLEGLAPDGSLWLRDMDGAIIPVSFGEVHLRPAL